MQQLVDQGSSPRGAVVPQHIQQKGLFALDVDDDIWQDIGLDDDSDGALPRWLADDNVRSAIKHQLNLDRSNEERIRLCKERCAMQEWMMEEWACVTSALKFSGLYFCSWFYILTFDCVHR
jgi:hypothetical protein